MTLIRRFILALQFLTVATLWPRLRVGDKDLAGSMAFYPLVGLSLGLALAWANRLMGFWPPVLADGVTVALGVILTRGLHLEGLADTADGLGSGVTTERALEIMKDSRAGSFAVMAVALDLLLRWAALMALPGFLKFQALLLMPVLSRWAMVGAAYRCPYARQGEGGLARAFVDKLSLWEIVPAALTGLVAAALIMGAKGGILFGGVTLFALAVRWVYIRCLGGITGDMIGALNEMTELGLLLVLAAWSGY